ncbi:MAG: PfkB family carbohydrate kinase, partial [Solirubrobacteraceae bacterium]
MTRVAVVGHVEWVQFVRVDRYPERGGLEQGRRESEHAGGGAVVAAAVLAELGAEVDFFCAPGDDQRGHAAIDELRARGIAVHPAWRDAPTRYVFTLLDAGGERTIITVGERLAPRGDDNLPWELLARVDGVYVTAGDSGAITLARRAPLLTASPRAGEPAPGVTVDAMILSESDEHERRWAASWEAQTRLMVATQGADGGRWWGESSGRWSPAPLPGPRRDSHDAGDPL